MQSKVYTKTIQTSDGKEIQIETGKLARQADGSVVVKMGNAMLLATIVSKKTAGEDVDFLPLSVDYQEKFASAGKIPGGFLKREGRLSDYEILICRLVDRAMRPLFPSDYHADTQVMISLISSDPQIMPDTLAALAASAAVSVSDIPFDGPISEARVIKKDGEFIINPTLTQIEGASLNLLVAATYENIMMVEGESKEVPESDVIEALKIAHEEIKIHCTAQKELAEEVGSTVKRTYSHEKHDEELKTDIHQKIYQKAYDIAAENINAKSERSEKFAKLKEDYIESLGEDTTADMFLVNQYFGKTQKQAIRNYVLDAKTRLDGRQPDEIRPIWSEIDYLPTAHGSAVFTRGETQSLSTVTLGTKLDEQMVDGAMFSGYNKFILHYNFPAFSVGEARPNRGPGRREVGHGNLALRALKPVLPKDEDNPYTIRIVSDILESNGSSSMATVCAGSLALMDAGVPVSGAVSGIAMGMISDPETGRYAILSDILGDEDHIGDMDFKVTGTANGITACQMDIKIDGLSYEVLTEALEQAKRGREHILGKINETISAPKDDLKPNAPRSNKMIIDKDLIGAVIGPGGKIIQEIQKVSGATVIIEEIDEKGHLSVFAVTQESMQIALDMIKPIVTKPEVGEVYNGKVKSIMPFGAFVEFMPGKDGLLHISEIKWEKLPDMDGVLEEGEEIQVKLIGIDKKTGKVKLSRKALLPRPERKPQDAS